MREGGISHKNKERMTVNYKQRKKKRHTSLRVLVSVHLPFSSRGFFSFVVIILHTNN